MLAGYRGADYVDVVRCCEVFTLLVPGSDGGCRATPGGRGLRDPGRHYPAQRAPRGRARR